MDQSELKPDLGNFIYTTVAYARAVTPWLYLYGYRYADNFYDNGNVLAGTNWWKVSTKTLLWSQLILFGIVFFTQFGSLFGYWYDYNLISWTIFIGFVQPVFDIFFLVTIGIARYQAYATEKNAVSGSVTESIAVTLGE